MKRVVLVAVAAAVVGTAAGAQPQFALPIIRDLRRAGVSEDCIAVLSTHTFAVLKGIQESQGQPLGKRVQRMKFKAEQACGQTGSVLDLMSR
jgi:hypothetical protein